MLAYNPVTFHKNSKKSPFTALYDVPSPLLRYKSERRKISPRIRESVNSNANVTALELFQKPPKVTTKLFNLVNSYQVKISKTDSDFTDFVINMKTCGDYDEELELFIGSESNNFEKLFNFNINEIKANEIDYEVNSTNLLIIIPKIHAISEYDHHTSNHRGRKLSSKVSKPTKKNQRVSSKVLKNLGNVHVPEYYQDRTQPFPVIFHHSSSSEDEEEEEEEVATVYYPMITAEEVETSDSEQEAEIFHLELEDKNMSQSSSESDSETDEEIEFDSEDSDIVDISDSETITVVGPAALTTSESEDEELVEDVDEFYGFSTAAEDEEEEDDEEEELPEFYGFDSEQNLSSSSEDEDSEEEQQEEGIFHHFEIEADSSESDTSNSDSDSESQILNSLPRVCKRVSLEEISDSDSDSDY